LLLWFWFTVGCLVSSDMTAVAVGDFKLLVFGGVSIYGQAMGDTFVLDWRQHQWTRVSDISDHLGITNLARSCGAGMLLNGSLYVTGGNGRITSVPLVVLPQIGSVD
jgi:hypothetical protein